MVLWRIRKPLDGLLINLENSRNFKFSSACLWKEKIIRVRLKCITIGFDFDASKKTFSLRKATLTLFNRSAVIVTGTFHVQNSDNATTTLQGSDDLRLDM